MAAPLDMKAVLAAMKDFEKIESETFLVSPTDFTRLVARARPSAEMSVQGMPKTFMGFPIVTDGRMQIGAMEFRSSPVAIDGKAIKLPRHAMFELQQRLDFNIMRAVRGERLFPAKPWTDDMRQMLDDIRAARWRR